MMSDPDERPVVRAVETIPLGESARIENVSFDAEGLSIAVLSNDGAARVHFAQTYGFRVLDETDLDDMWEVTNLRAGWLMEVVRGGWRDLELRRPHFHSGRQAWVREYLIVGLDACVSVLTKEQPDIQRVEPDLASWVAAYIELQSGDRNNASEHPMWWAVTRFYALNMERPEACWEAILAILALNPPAPVLGILAAGPLEDLIDDHGPQFIERIELEASQNQAFRALLSGVWESSTPDIWARIQAACGVSAAGD